MIDKEEKERLERFLDAHPSARYAQKIELCEDGEVFVHYPGSAYPMIYKEVEDESL